MSRAVFIHPDDNLSPVATGGSEWAAQTGAVDSDPNYGLTKLGGVDAAMICKCTTAGPFAVVRDLGSAKQVDFAVIPMHSCDAGGVVRFQMAATNSWGAPSVDVTCTVPTWFVTKPAMPVGLLFDLRGIAQATRTQRWVRVSAPANASKILSFGPIVFGLVRELARNISWGLQSPETVLSAVGETPLGGRVGYRLGTLRRSLKGTVKTTDVGREQLRTLYHAAAGVTPFGFALDPAVVDGQFVFWDAPYAPAWTFLDFHVFEVAFLEQSRGRPL